MKNFGIGLSLGLIGMMLWYVGIVAVSCEEAFGEMPTIGDEIPDDSRPPSTQSSETGGYWQLPIIKYGGFGLMVAGPVVYWVILPVIELVKRRREERGLNMKRHPEGTNEKEVTHRTSLVRQVRQDLK